MSMPDSVAHAPLPPVAVDDSVARAFAQAPADDPAKPRLVRCLNPFRWLEVSDGGITTPCCSPWFKQSLGNIKERSMQEIWNGPEMQEARAAMYPGGNWQKWCNASTCAQIRNDTWVPIDTITPETHDIVPITQPMLDEIRAGHVVMQTPPVQIGVSCDPRCNLKCIMCSTLVNPNRDGVALRAALDGIRSFLPSVQRLKMMGDGEVFAVPESRDFLFNFDPQANPDTSFLIHTNGLLMTEKMWDKIDHIKIDYLIVSMDGATKETFEKIRVGGNWEKLVENLRFLVGKLREGRIREMSINMTVMKSNVHEVAKFAEFGLDLGVTSTYFQPVIGDYGEEQIFDRRDIDALTELRRQLHLPVMSNPKVDFNAIQEWKTWRPSAKQWARHHGKRLAHKLPAPVENALRRAWKMVA